MSELLTTGEMIDRLKVGEVAESKNFKAYFDDKNLQLVSESKNTGVKTEFTIWSGIRGNSIWRILPKYVTFEEAMKALKDGKMVCLLREDGQKMLSPFHKTTIIQRLDGIGRSFDSWFNGKWQIIE